MATTGLGIQEAPPGLLTFAVAVLLDTSPRPTTHVVLWWEREGGGGVCSEIFCLKIYRT